MKIIIRDARGNDVIYKLNESQAAHSFYYQLPMTAMIQNFYNNEKGFVLPKKLNVFGAPLAPGGMEALCYYKPWNQVVMCYGGYSDYDGLYELGTPVSGQGQVRNLKGTVLIEAIQ